MKNRPRMSDAQAAHRANKVLKAAQRHLLPGERDDDLAADKVSKSTQYQEIRDEVARFFNLDIGDKDGR